MRWHKVIEPEVVSAISKPDFLSPSLEGKQNAWIKVPEKYLRVTYKEEADRILVITAVKKKKGWR